MKRRDFLHAVVTVPAVGVLLEQPSAAQNPVPPGQAPGATTAGAGNQNAVLETVVPDTVATTVPRFFTVVQFATLRRLADLLLPPINGKPGALDAGAPEFLDQYTAASAEDRQRLYRAGLDDLNKQALARHRKSFADLTTAEADAIVKPLLNVRGPLLSVVDLGPFINRVHQDVRTVTLNSIEWAAARTASGTPPPPTLYWRKVDPTIHREEPAPWQKKSTKS